MARPASTGRKTEPWLEEVGVRERSHFGWIEARDLVLRSRSHPHRLVHHPEEGDEAKLHHTTSVTMDVS